MAYRVKLGDEFERSLRKNRRKNPVLHRAILEKIDEILEHPTHHKPLRGNKWGYRRVHFGSFVLLYAIRGDVVFVMALEHHDDAY